MSDGSRTFRPPKVDVLREQVDARGIVRMNELIVPADAATYRVFAQRSNGCIVESEFEAHAARFFREKVGLSIPKRYAELVERDAALVVVRGREHWIDTRPVEAHDREEAEAAELRQGGGLALVARRCAYLLRVAIHPDDREAALLFAAIAASVLLGPILTPEGELLGVKSARARLSR